MIKVSKNKVEIPFSILEEYCKAVDKSLEVKDNIFISYREGKLSFFSQDKLDSMNVGSSVCLELEVESGHPPFSAGVDALRFLSLTKKLYEGTVTLTFTDSKLEVKEDNIKASFAKAASRGRYNLPEFLSIKGDQKDWIVRGLSDCLSSISETSKTSATNKMIGILFDTQEGVSRICKFSQASLYILTAQAVFGSDFRMVFPDALAKIAKSFKSSIESILLSDNQAGLELQSGTKIYMPKPFDTYPKDYVAHLHLSYALNVIPEGSPSYDFDVNSLINAIDLVAVSLGDTDSWVNLSTVGRSNGRMVWRIGGKNYKDMEVQEEITSSDGEALEIFRVNKDRALKALSLFKDNVTMYNLDPSVLGLSSTEGDMCAILVKARI